MPLIGYFAGSLFASFVDSIDHYIAFIILVFLGYKMIKEAMEDKFEDEVKKILKIKHFLFWQLQLL